MPGSATLTLVEWLSPEKLLVVVIIALVLFGPKRIPELGRSLGKGMRGFTQALAGEEPDEGSKEAHSRARPTADAPVSLSASPVATKRPPPKADT